MALDFADVTEELRNSNNLTLRTVATEHRRKMMI